MRDLVLGLKAADFFVDGELIRALGSQLGNRLLTGKPAAGITDEQELAVEEISCMSSEAAVAVLSASNVTMHRKLAYLPGVLHPEVLVATFPKLRTEGAFVLDCHKHSTSSITSALASVHRVATFRELHLIHFCTNASLPQPSNDPGSPSLQAWTVQTYSPGPVKALCELAKHPQLKGFKLHDADMSSAEFQSLITALASNSSLTHLELTRVILLDYHYATPPPYSIDLRLDCVSKFERGARGSSVAKYLSSTPYKRQTEMIKRGILPVIHQPCLSQLTQLHSLTVKTYTDDPRSVNNALVQQNWLKHSISKVFPSVLACMTRLTSLSISDSSLCSRAAARLLSTTPRLIELAVNVTLLTGGESGMAGSLMQLTRLTSLSFVACVGGDYTQRFHMTETFLESLGGAIQHLAPQLRQLSLELWLRGVLGELSMQNLPASLRYLSQIASLSLFISTRDFNRETLLRMLRSLPGCRHLSYVSLQVPGKTADGMVRSYARSSRLPDLEEIRKELLRMPALADLRLSDAWSQSDMRHSAQQFASSLAGLCACSELTKVVISSQLLHRSPSNAIFEGLLASQKLRVLQIGRKAELSEEQHGHFRTEPVIDAAAAHALPSDGNVLQHLALERMDKLQHADICSPAASLRQLTSLTFLRLRQDVAILSPCVELFTALRKLVKLRVLALDEIQTTDSNALSNCVPCMPQLQQLSLRRFNMTDTSLQVLSVPLSMLPELESVAFSKCGVTDVGAQHLAHALQGMLRMKAVNLSENMISDVGVEPLASALPVTVMNTVLQALL